jgi:hypothetical protein
MIEIPNELNALVAELGERIGITSLAFGDRGFTLRFDGKIQVNFQYDESRDMLVMSADIGPLPSQDPIKICIKLLRGNRLWHQTGGATLSLTESDQPNVLIAIAEPWRSLNGEQLIGRIELFLGVAAQWQVMMLDDESPLSFGDNNVLRV